VVFVDIVSEAVEDDLLVAGKVRRAREEGVYVLAVHQVWMTFEVVDLDEEVGRSNLPADLFYRLPWGRWERKSRCRFSGAWVLGLVEVLVVEGCGKGSWYVGVEEVQVGVGNSFGVDVAFVGAWY
jgi:hypothetical protein